MINLLKTKKDYIKYLIIIKLKMIRIEMLIKSKIIGFLDKLYRNIYKKIYSLKI